MKYSPDAYLLHESNLFSEAVNYQPCSIEYEENCLYFNMYHGMYKNHLPISQLTDAPQ